MVQSAAIINYHTGKNPDSRAQSTLKANGITNYSHKARQVRFSQFSEVNITDLIAAFATITIWQDFSIY